MNKLDKIIDVLTEDMDAKTLLKLVMNKMTNPAKRQMIGEMLNTIYGSGYSTNSSMFNRGREDE